MPNKAIARKISSVTKSESRSNTSTKSASKPKAKSLELHVSTEPAAPKKVSRNGRSATSTVVVLPSARVKESKDIDAKFSKKASKKATLKDEIANDGVIQEEHGEKLLGKEVALESTNTWKKQNDFPIEMKSVTRDIYAPLSNDTHYPAQQKNADVGNARLQAVFSAMPAHSSIKIFQVYYHERQSPFLDADFEPYDNSGDGSPLLEFNAFAKLLQSKELQDVKLWGALSWNFWQKTGISGAEFKKEIETNPGYDVYFCNPHSEIETLYHNLWLQGEISHPNFIPLCKEIFEVANLPAELLTEIQPSQNFATSNYFVATPLFWKRYAAFVSRVLLAANQKLSSTARAILFSPTADPSGIHVEASYIPFVIERLFSVFLRTEGHNFRAYKISPRNMKDHHANVHLKLLGEMRSLACRTKSAWMASCWVNYRNLYLTNVYGTPWANKYLKNQTPQTIVFAPDAENITCGATGK